MLPIDTKADSPSPRAAASARKARPSAPLWEEKPMLPAGMPAGPERRVEPRRRGGDAEAVGADQPAAVRAHEREQRVLARRALGAGLGESGGDHAQRPYAAAERGLGRLDHALGRHGDDRQVERVRHVGDRGVGAHARDRLGVRVDRVRRAREVAGHDVAEQLAADRAPPRRGAHDGHAGGREERRQRGGDGQVVAAVDALEVAGGRLDRQRHLGDAALVLALDLEARALEDAQHRAVVGQHLREEAADPHLAGLLRELLEQPRADALALQLVGDRERDLGARRVAQPHVAAERDDPLARRVGDRARQRAALEPVGIQHRLDEPRRRLREAVEAQVAALVGEVLEERDHARLVVVRGRAQAHRGAVAQYDVALRGAHRANTVTHGAGMRETTERCSAASGML